jgi:hypothetical protein
MRIAARQEALQGIAALLQDQWDKYQPTGLVDAGPLTFDGTLAATGNSPAGNWRSSPTSFPIA